VIMMNIMPQSTNPNGEPTSTSTSPPTEPRCLELDVKSKESPPPVDNSPKSTGFKDKRHEQENGNFPRSSLPAG
jgi:hypothetical protein